MSHGGGTVEVAEPNLTPLLDLVLQLLMFFLIGFVLMFAVGLWFIARSILGLQALQRGEPVKNPESWFLGL